MENTNSNSKKLAGKVKASGGKAIAVQANVSKKDSAWITGETWVISGGYR